jgi:hypothetical protein
LGIVPAPTSPEPSAAEALRELASLTPAQLAAEIRCNAADVNAQAEAWRSSPEWNGDERDRAAYETVVQAIGELDTIPEPTEYRDIQSLIHAVSPIFDLWWTDRPGTHPDWYKPSNAYAVPSCTVSAGSPTLGDSLAPKRRQRPGRRMRTTRNGTVHPSRRSSPDSNHKSCLSYVRYTN